MIRPAVFVGLIRIHVFFTGYQLTRKPVACVQICKAMIPSYLSDIMLEESYHFELNVVSFNEKITSQLRNHVLGLFFI